MGPCCCALAASPLGLVLHWGHLLVPHTHFYIFFSCYEGCLGKTGSQNSSCCQKGLSVSTAPERNFTRKQQRGLSGTWHKGPVLAFGAVAHMKNGDKVQAGKRTLDIIIMLVNTLRKEGEKKACFVRRATWCCLYLGRQNCYLVQLEMVRAERCPMTKCLTYLEKTCPCDLITHRRSSSGSLKGCC